MTIELVHVSFADTVAMATVLAATGYAVSLYADDVAKWLLRKWGF
ncbi:MAG: hypothetical protein WAX89_06800 [Alphaproteobacteria bacterium]